MTANADPPRPGPGRQPGKQGPRLCNPCDKDPAGPSLARPWWSLPACPHLGRGRPEAGLSQHTALVQAGATEVAHA